jgi:DTW domain-containing protein YfiP
MAARQRCNRCMRPLPSCYCKDLVAINNEWSVCILQDPQEQRHPLGTARIAQCGLRDCQLHVVTDGAEALAARLFTHPTALIYPGKDSQDLRELPTHSIQTLVFIDATWRKSRRLLLESEALQALPRYALTNTPPSRYRIRREPQPEALSTLEAIVWSLSLLEQQQGKYAPLLKIMDKLVDEHIRHMGPETYARNYQRHPHH